MATTLQQIFKFSYIKLLYDGSVRAKTPFFRVDSSAIQVIDDPLNFYLHLNVKILPKRQVPIILFIESVYRLYISELEHLKGIYYPLSRKDIRFVQIWCQLWPLIIIAVAEKKMERLLLRFYKGLENRLARKHRLGLWK